MSPNAKPKVSIVKCAGYDSAEVFAAVGKAVELAGGISNFVSPKSRVLVKPNLLLAKEPEYGIDTHPEVVRSVIKILKGINCSIMVGDSPSVFDNQTERVDEVFEKSGMRKVCEEEGVTLVKFDKRRWHGKFPLTARLDECDHLVSVPKFKTHNLTLLTAAIKNLYGLVPGTFKLELHKNYFNLSDFVKVLVDIYQEARPSLTVVDGIVAMEGEGPGTSGKLRKQNLLLASSDCVALDSVLSVIMGLKPFDILSTKEAAERGLGVADIKSIEIAGVRLEDAAGRPFIVPSASMQNKKLPKPVVDLAKKLIRYYPCVERDRCVRCAVCLKTCPKKAISLDKGTITFDYSKCIACFCCQEACPSSAIKTKKSLLVKLLRL